MLGDEMIDEASHTMARAIVAKGRGRLDRALKRLIVTFGRESEKQDINCCYLPRTSQSVRASMRPSVISSEFRSAAAIQRASAASSPGRNVPPVTVTA